MLLAVSPMQRFFLYQLSWDVGQKYKGQEARRFRRFCKHLGIDAIADVARVDGHVAIEQVKITQRRTFEVDAEDLDRLHRVDEDVERTGEAESVLGPLFDDVIELRAGREVGYQNALAYDPAAERWSDSAEQARALQAVPATA